MEYLNFHAHLFTVAIIMIARICRQPERSSAEEWIKKMYYVCSMEYYLVTRKKEILLCYLW